MLIFENIIHSKLQIRITNGIIIVILLSYHQDYIRRFIILVI
jgi:hypothetical protein